MKQLTVRSKLAVPARLVAAVVLSGLLMSATAGASDYRASSPARVERAYSIDIAVDRAALKVTRADVLGAENRIQAQLTTCLTSDLVQITDAEPSQPNAQKALLAISEEAGAQYEIAALKPLLGPLIAGARRLLQLPLPTKTFAPLRKYLTGLTEVQTLNACADAQAWLASGLGAAQEPSDTSQTPVALADLRALAGGKDGTGATKGLTPDQLRYAKAERLLADKHVGQLTIQTERSLESWIEQVSVSVNRTATTTQTSTTGTQTSTTGTQTGTTAA